MRIIITLMLSVLGTLLISELALRLFWHNPYRFESPDHMVKLLVHHPNTDHFFNRALVNPEQPRGRLRTDARSYILPSYQYRDPDVTIAFLGGSTTECSAVLEDLRFPALVSKLLAQRGLKVNTLNAARSGNTVHDSLNVLLNHVSHDRPDIVVLMEASNDVGVLLNHGGYQSRTGHPVRIMDLGKWMMQIASSDLYLAGLLRHGATFEGSPRPLDPRSDWGNQARLSSSNTSTVPFRQRLKSFVHLSRDFGIHPILMTQPFSGSTNSMTPNWIDVNEQDRFNTVIREVGVEESVSVIDLVRYLQEHVPEWNKPMEIFYDAIHVTDKGSILYAEHIATRLLPLINQRIATKASSSAH
ncbi:MAG: SGNH/GDSL hydrolase family protein [Nitrospiraceae bacterium]